AAVHDAHEVVQSGGKPGRGGIAVVSSGDDDAREYSRGDSAGAWGGRCALALERGDRGRGGFAGGFAASDGVITAGCVDRKTPGRDQRRLPERSQRRR